MRIIRLNDLEAVSTPVFIGGFNAECQHPSYFPVDTLGADKSPAGVVVTIERCAMCGMAVRSHYVATDKAHLDAVFQETQL